MSGLLIRMVVLLPVLFGLGIAQNAREVLVMGDRVNLRLKPDYTGLVLAQANFHDRLQVVEIQKEWVRVKPLTNIACWVHGDYLHDLIVKPKTLRVRSGPSTDFDILGELTRGTKVTQIATNGSWVRIPTLEEIPLFISRDYVEEIAPPPTRIPSSPPESAPKTTNVTALIRPNEAMRPGPPSVAPTPPPVSVRPLAELKPTEIEFQTPSAHRIQDQEIKETIAPLPLPPGLTLVPLAGQGRETTRKGRLRIPLFRGNSPTPFRLMVPQGGRELLLCYIAPQDPAALKPLKGEWLAVQGSEYWVQGSDVPVLVPRKMFKKNTTTD